LARGDLPRTTTIVSSTSSGAAGFAAVRGVRAGAVAAGTRGLHANREISGRRRTIDVRGTDYEVGGTEAIAQANQLSYMKGIESDADKARWVPIAALVPWWRMAESAVGIEWRGAVLAREIAGAAPGTDDLRVDAGAAGFTGSGTSQS
jgi:hypothetical protein